MGFFHGFYQYTDFFSPGILLETLLEIMSLLRIRVSLARGIYFIKSICIKDATTERAGTQHIYFRNTYIRMA